MSDFLGQEIHSQSQQELICTGRTHHILLIDEQVEPITSY